ncbi:MAG: HisA/HisF-related TIM barrel protein, partial [Phenylobacterium sp.]
METGLRPGAGLVRRRGVEDGGGAKVATQGWTENTDLDAVTVARRFEDAGVGALIITDI